MKKYFILFLILWGNVAFGQNVNTESAEHYIGEFYRLYGITVSVPCDFHAEVDNVGWKNNVDYKHSLGGLYNLLATRNDGNCIVMYPLVVDRLIQTGVNSSVDGLMGFVNRELLQSFNVMDEDNKMKSNKPSSYYPGLFLTTISGYEVKEMFNVDRICYYSMDCREGMFRNCRGEHLSFNPDDYSHIIRLFFMKEGGYHFDVLLLMTDDAYRDKAECISSLAGTIKFDEDRIQKVWERVQ